MEALLIAYAPLVMKLGFEFAGDLVAAVNRPDAANGDSLRALHAKWGSKMAAQYLADVMADTTLPGPVSLTPAPGTTTTIKTEPTV